MFAGKLHEIIHVWLNGLHTALHGGDGVGLSLHAYTLSHDGTKA